MSEETISLYELLNLSIGTPQKGAVNFGALHALLHAVLRQLDIRELKTQWRDTPPGDGHPDAPVGVTAPKQDHHTEEDEYQIQRDKVEQDVQPGTELHQRIASSSSPTPSSGPEADRQWRLRSRIQSCEDDVSKAMKLIQELHDQKDNLTEEIKELRHQREVEKCCHRVDVLEETVRSLRVTIEGHPDPQLLSRCVTWDVMQAALLPERESVRQELVNSGAVDPSTVVKPTHTPVDSSFTAVNTAPGTSTPSSPSPVEDTGRPATEAGRAAAERYPETVEALRNVGKLRETFGKLEARVAALEEGKADQWQLTHLRERIANKDSQDASNHLTDGLNQQRALIDRMMSEREKLDNLEDVLTKRLSFSDAKHPASGEDRWKQTGRGNVELVNDVQRAILQLQAECERLHEATRCLHEDNRQKQSHIEELYKTTEELEEKKADKQMVESEIKADKSALESKVSRLQFDSVTEQLNAMFHELLNKVTGQEQDWHKVIDKLSTEMECKLNRIELDSVKKQLEGRWKNIHEKLQAQGAPEHEDAAALRKQLVDRFHCLSCDRPVVKYTSGPHLVKLPSTPGFPAHRSIRPFTVYALEQFRQHYRSERISELTDYGHLAVSRSCGGSHTVTSASQRRTGLQSVKHHTQTEVDGTTQSEEVDIVGLDGHIYKGRLNAAPIRTTETKLPTISTRDGVCKTKDKAKCSSSHKPAGSPEGGHGTPLHYPHSAKSVQCSRSASSSSGRDWPVSALGCTSQSSLTQASAAAESNAEPQADAPLNL